MDVSTEPGTERGLAAEAELDTADQSSWRLLREPAAASGLSLPITCVKGARLSLSEPYRGK
jgi:hypothetical protein